mmetsp:Transcript_14776/g.32667  ORF Transcript_14776/g.32667 Transcript_14776/m.32667 type:complete len:236 (-) Transcript_14776:4484-5191(-)
MGRTGCSWGTSSCRWIPSSPPPFISPIRGWPSSSATFLTDARRPLSKMPPWKISPFPKFSASRTNSISSPTSNPSSSSSCATSSASAVPLSSSAPSPDCSAPYPTRENIPTVSRTLPTMADLHTKNLSRYYWRIYTACVRSSAKSRWLFLKVDVKWTSFSSIFWISSTNRRTPYNPSISSGESDRTMTTPTLSMMMSWPCRNAITFRTLAISCRLSNPRGKKIGKPPTRPKRPIL